MVGSGHDRFAAGSPERVRGLLMRQAVQSAKQALAVALAEFRTTLARSG